MRLEVQDLYYQYGTCEVLHGLSFGADAGEILGVAGPNGCGKTTLIKCIDRIFEPKGRILLDGEDITRMNGMEVARRIAYVPQSLTLGMAMTVFETILLGRRPFIRWSVSDNDLQRVHDTINLLKIRHLAFRKMTQISGGERQKVMVARAMVQDPALLLLDEPTSALDLKHQLEVMELVRMIAHDRQACVVMAIHDLNLASRFCDWLLLMKEGRIARVGRPDEMLREETILEVYEVEARISSESGYRQITPLRAV